MESVNVRIPQGWLWTLSLVGAALGVGVAFAVGPTVDWLVGLIGSAPGPLRLAARMPLAWAVPVLGVVGTAAGAWVGHTWQNENAIVTVGADATIVANGGERVHIRRDQVAAVFTDGRDLVLLDAAGLPLSRSKADDVLVGGLRSAFERFGYPWRGTGDPHEKDFITWVDRSPDLDEPTHGLLRARHRALADKRPGEAAQALDALRAQGLVVRDRAGAQEYRRARPV
jgi:hypothetical protein